MQETNLKYIDDLLERAKPSGYPLIYIYWGVVVFVGYIFAEIKPEWSHAYWVSMILLGVIVSGLLGYYADKKRGQIDDKTDMAYLKHFGVMIACIFIAMWQADNLAILLLVGLSYCLAGLYLDKIMLISGIITILAYVGVAESIITSNIILGAIIAAGLFATAWASSRHSQQ